MGKRRKNVRGCPQPSTALRREYGLVIVLIVPLLMVLFFLAWIVTNRAHVGMISTELQAATDAAALAGAGTLCSQKACYDDARIAAIRVINNHIAHGTAPGALQMSISEAGGPVWDQTNLRVVIERGRWTPGGGFLSFDQTTFEADHPGIPIFIAANAVRVEVRRRGVGFLMFSHPVKTHDQVAAAVAIGGAVESVPVGPFALPVCSLITDRGDFSARAECGYDRVFTRVDRYCVDAIDPAHNDQCLIFPANNFIHESQWFKCRSSNAAYCQKYAACNDADCAIGPWGNLGGGMGMYCGWYAPHTGQISDHYGVVGMPVAAGSSITDETAVLNSTILADGTPIIRAKIGDSFAILSAGFTQRSTHDRLWSIMDGPGPYNQDLGFTGNLQCTPVNPSPPILPAPGCACLNGMSAPRYGCDGTPAWTPPVIGMCNSQRVLCEHRREGGTWAPQPPYYPWTCTNIVTLGFPNFYAWKISIPVIADTSAGAAPCKGFGNPPAPYDPPIDPSKTYEIIGFIQVKLYDLDIGAPPPQKPADLIRTRPPGMNDIKWPECVDKLNTDPNRWGFNVPGLPGCNMIRGFTACDTSLIPSKEHVGRAQPRLVS